MDSIYSSKTRSITEMSLDPFEQLYQTTKVRFYNLSRIPLYYLKAVFLISIVCVALIFLDTVSCMLTDYCIPLRFLSNESGAQYETKRFIVISGLITLFAVSVQFFLFYLGFKFIQSKYPAGLPYLIVFGAAALAISLEMTSGSLLLKSLLGIMWAGYIISLLVCYFPLKKLVKIEEEHLGYIESFI